MIVRPRCWRYDSPHPQPIPIPTGGTPRPPRCRISPRPFRGGLELVPDPIGHLGGTPTVVVAAAIVIIVVVDGTPTSTSSSRVGRPITRGPVDVDVAVGAAATELFDFRSVPSPRGRWRGHRREWSLLSPPPSWRQGPTTTTTKTVASLSRRRRRRRGDDGNKGTTPSTTVTSANTSTVAASAQP
jgi:hypothetical protein